MKALRVILVALCALAAFPARAQIADCTRFREAMTQAAGDLNASFARPLIVSRARPSEFDQYDLVSHARVDGRLLCQGETFHRFEATIHLPADAALLARFATAQEAALVAALGWSHVRARAKVLEIAHETSEYLRGSIEREDHEIAGKLEEHLADGVDIGAIHTRTERTFMLLNGG